MPSKWRGCTLMLMAIFFSSANCSRVFPNSPLAAWILDNLSPPLPPNFLTPSLGFIIACLLFCSEYLPLGLLVLEFVELIFFLLPLLPPLRDVLWELLIEFRHLHLLSVFEEVCALISLLLPLLGIRVG